MRDYKMGKGTTEHYTSLEDLRKAWGLRPIVKKTSDTKKLEKQQEHFRSRHLCKACGKPMEHISGTNQMCCKNPECLGIKVESPDGEVEYLVSYNMLDEQGAEIANNIFS